MRILFSPSYNGACYIDMQGKSVALDQQVLNMEGLLTQLALHLGIHHEVPSYPVRLTAYHQALIAYDKKSPDNIFHNSLLLDSMSVAKTLMQWRDTLAMWRWKGDTLVNGSTRLNTLAKIEEMYSDDGVATLLRKVEDALRQLVESGKAPEVLRSMEIVIPCDRGLLPEYAKQVLLLLEQMGTAVTVDKAEASNAPQSIEEVRFSQQWKAEAWLAQQDAERYDVWINADNKRLDNWLHMSGKPLCGSEMENSNPQITQMFLLAVQLFQRPLNVNTLLQYLYLPECPLHGKLVRRLSRTIVREGGFGSSEVQKCIEQYVSNEYIENDDAPDYTEEERKKNLKDYLPFTLEKEDEAILLTKDNGDVEMKGLVRFVKKIKDYAASRAVKLDSVSGYDPRVPQLHGVASMAEALLGMLDTWTIGTIPFKTLLQWAQSLYNSASYMMYGAQVGCQTTISNPACMIGKAENCVWCDFYGDVAMHLSTDFLSNNEKNLLREKGALPWEPEQEKEYGNLMLAQPLHLTGGKLTLVTCDKQGATKLPMHPLYLQLPLTPTVIDGDELFERMQTKEIVRIDNHKESDKMEIAFDAEAHPVAWRDTESFSSLGSLLQDPFDYFMHYTLGFTDISATEIKLSLTFGNVAHEVVEMMFAPGKKIDMNEYEDTFSKALFKKGALLLLPEHHLDKDRLHYQLRNSIEKLAEVISNNRLTVVMCEQEEVEDLGFEDGTMVKGYIDMLLKDEEGKDVVFDLKWTSKKDKHKKLIENNRAAQLAIYQAMLKKHENCCGEARTGFFVMPEGCLYSKDRFVGKHCEKVDAPEADMIGQLRLGYAERRREIGEGKIETAAGVSITELTYADTQGVYPLEDDGKKRDPKKIGNEYSDYNCFTI